MTLIRRTHGPIHDTQLIMKTQITIWLNTLSKVQRRHTLGGTHSQQLLTAVCYQDKIQEVIIRP